MKLLRAAIFANLTLIPFGLSSQLTNPETITDTYLKAASEPGAVIFTPPEGWGLADPAALPKSVKAMVLGKGKHELPPSISLGMHKYDGTLKDYLKMVKATNLSERSDWKDLGTIRTEAGNASLSQLDMKTKWGELREMQVIMKRDDMIYILTAAALKDEFPKFYNDFFSAMRSLRFNGEVESTISQN